MTECLRDNGIKFGAADWEELLGRLAIQDDIPSHADFHQGKSILITGAGGSVGSALTEKIAAYKPRLLLLLDSSEHNLYRLDAQLRGRYKVASPIAIAGSITDADLLSTLCRQYRPELIYHTAAYKHVPMMEFNPFAAMQNNALGTHRLAQAALQHRVSQVWMVSTDKAANPASIMGASKRVAEMTLQTASSSRTRMNSIRLGNILGSQGSVVPLFLDQISQNQRVTVTHPNAERFFFTMQETISLILEAMTSNLHSKILVPSSAKPIKIVDLARFLIARHGLLSNEASISFTGLRPGEKLREEFIAQDERIAESFSSRLHSVESAGIPEAKMHSAIAGLEDSIRRRDLENMLRIVQSLVPDYQPSKELLQSQTTSESVLHG